MSSLSSIIQAYTSSVSYNRVNCITNGAKDRKARIPQYVQGIVDLGAVLGISFPVVNVQSPHLVALQAGNSAEHPIPSTDLAAVIDLPSAHAEPAEDVSMGCTPLPDQDSACAGRGGRTATEPELLEGEGL